MLLLLAPAPAAAPGELDAIRAAGWRTLMLLLWVLSARAVLGAYAVLAAASYQSCRIEALGAPVNAAAAVLGAITAAG